MFYYDALKSSTYIYTQIEPNCTSNALVRQKPFNNRQSVCLAKQTNMKMTCLIMEQVNNVHTYVVLILDVVQKE